MINRQLLAPESIVVVGGSNDTTKPGGKILYNLLAGNYAGSLQVIHPKAPTVQGVSAAPSARDMPAVELAIIAVAAKYTKAYVQELLDKGTKAFIILSAGFSELDDAGRRLEQEIVDLVNRAGAALIGPNCIGVLTPAYHGIFAGPVPSLHPSGCDFVSGSGATAAFIIEKGMPLGLTFASLFSVGNSAQIGVEDVLRYWDETYEPGKSASVKLVYMENISKPKMFLRHASSLVGKGCRIAAVKAGSSSAGSRAASSHTGALASSDVAVDALLRKSGVVRCYGREELVYTAAVFSHGVPAGRNIAIVTHAGGPGVMLTDTLAKHGLEVPELKGPEVEALLKRLHPGSSVSNPIDFLATGTAEQLADIIETTAAMDDIHGLVAIYGSPGLFDVTDVYRLLLKKISAVNKPVYPVLPSVITAAGALETYKQAGGSFFADEVLLGQALGRIMNTPSPAPAAGQSVDKQNLRAALAGCRPGYIAPAAIAALLDAAGIPRVPEAVTADWTEAQQHVHAMGFPLVMKVVGPVHKTDVAGVVLNVTDIATAREQFDRLMGIPDARSVLFQPMKQGIELFLGAKAEPAFGHVILCGLGGVFVEVLKDVQAGLCPISSQEALDMIHSLKGHAIIRGVRGKTGINEQVFADIIARLSGLLQAVPEIAELDFNPLMGRADDVVVVDARIRLEKPVT